MSREKVAWIRKLLPERPSVCHTNLNALTINNYQSFHDVFVLPQLLGRRADKLPRGSATPGFGVSMTVAALSTAGFSQYISASSNLSGSQQAWQSLQQSLASGNLTAAESAFKAYSQLNPSTTSSSSSTSGASQLSTDMSALGSALSSGNLSTAQSAFATVQNDLKSTPSQSMANATAAVVQTVQWVDDLLSLSNSGSSSDAAPADPTTAILNSAYGLSSSSSSTNPTVALLESKYGDGGSSAAPSSTAGSSSTDTSAIVSSGNAGSSASVNVYA